MCNNPERQSGYNVLINISLLDWTSSVAIPVELEIKGAINKLKQIIPPARPCLFKIYVETRIKAAGFGPMEEKCMNFYFAHKEYVNLANLIHQFSHWPLNSKFQIFRHKLQTTYFTLGTNCSLGVLTNSWWSKTHKCVESVMHMNSVVFPLTPLE